MTLCFKNFENNKKFIIVNLVLNFYKNEFFSKKHYLIPLAQIVSSNYII